MRFKSVFDPRFRYRNADSTDVRLTFERIRREYRKIQGRPAQEQTTQECSVEKEPSAHAKGHINGTAIPHAEE